MGGDATLDSNRVVLVASLIIKLKIDFGQIIADEMFIRAHKVASCVTIFVFDHEIMQASQCAFDLKS